MLVLVILMGLGSSTYAFNPFSILSVGQKVSGIFGEEGDSDTISAMDDLFLEINSDENAVKESKRIREEIEKIEALYREADALGLETEKSVRQLESAKNLADTIRGVTSAIRTSKRLAKSVGSLQKRAQDAEIEAATYEREQLLLQYEQYNLQKLQELRVVRQELEAELNKRRLSQTLEKDLKLKGARALGSKGLLRSPKTNEVIEDGLLVAQKIRPYLLSLVLAILLMRIIYYQFSFEAADRYWDPLRDVFICFMMLLCYPEVIRASHHLSLSLADSLLLGDREVTYESIWTKVSLSSMEKFKLSLFHTAELVWQLIRWFGYITAEFCFKYLVLIMVVMTPIVIFMSEMFNFPLGWKVFFLGFICLNLWPVLWNLFGKLMEQAVSRDFSVITPVETVVAMLLQLFSPIILYSLAKAGAAGGLSAAESVAGPAKQLAMRAILPGTHAKDSRPKLELKGKRA